MDQISTPINSLSDKNLMLKISEADKEAIELLYDRYSQLLYGLILKIVEEEETAEEVLAEVFRIIWTRPEYFNSDTANVYTWMIMLARKKAIDTIRRKRGDEGIPEYNDQYELQNIIPKLSPKNKILERDKIVSKLDKISNLLNVLYPDQKLILNEVFYKASEDKVIAQKLNIPVAAVKLKLQFILETLMQRLYK
jgi:RNA polymerase sigma factor (sigma-70 family)